jgi:hypothetical protein
MPEQSQSSPAHRGEFAREKPLMDSAKPALAGWQLSLLAGADPHNPGDLDTHPLIREYLGEQLRGQRTEAWKECNSRRYEYYRTLAPQLPNNFREMEPLF